MQHADDVVEVIPKDRVARVPARLREGDRVARRDLHRDRDHLRPRRHHALDREVGEADHALQHELLLRVQLARLVARLHDEPQLVGAVVRRRLHRAVDPEQRGHRPAALVEQPDRRPEDRAKDPQRPHHQQRHPIGVLQRDALRRELSGHDVQHGDEDERHDDRYRVRPDRAERRVEQPGQRRLADPAERQARERDPELAGRDVTIEVPHPVVDVARARPPLGEELLHARPPQGHERELGRDEEAVQKDQEEDGEQAAADLEHGALHQDGSEYRTTAPLANDPGDASGGSNRHAPD